MIWKKFQCFRRKGNMEFDKLRVYTALNADELKIGSKIIASDYLINLKSYVEMGTRIQTLKRVLGENKVCRFDTEDDGAFALAYLVSEPGEKKLKWTDLEIGDVIQNKESTHRYMIIGIDARPSSKTHIFNGLDWLDEIDLERYWEKVEK